MDREEREVEKKRLEFEFNIERRKENYNRQLIARRTEKGSSKNRPGASGRLGSVAVPSLFVLHSSGSLT